MRSFFLIVSLLASLVTSLPEHQAGATVAAQRRTASSARGQTAEVAAIEAYCDGLERYFKNTPQARRFYVDALPESGAEPSLEGVMKWYEVKTEEEMYEAERLYAHHSIVVSVKDGEVVSASIAEPEEHQRHDNQYCFRRDGTLAKIVADFNSNTLEGHVVRENFYDARGHLLRATSQCFKITTTSNGSREKRVSCRQSVMSGELKEYRIPVYQRNMELPGYEFLKSR
jgi:hypothetical protein